MAGFIKGAFVELIPTALVPIPNVIVFQFNPETMTHTWTQPEPSPAGTNATVSDPYAVTHEPGESFSFVLALDAGDSIATGTASAVIAEATGVYSRLAALEMLLYPASSTANPLSAAGGGLVGTVTAAIGSALHVGAKQAVPENTLNTVLFVWGPGRIVPVRITGITVTERLYDAALSPTLAEVQITLRVPTDEELRHTSTKGATLARVANGYTQTLRLALAAANLANAGESVLGMLPI
jgi:hypothetical protein